MDVAKQLTELLQVGGGYGLAAVFGVVIWRLYGKIEALNEELRTAMTSSVKELTTAMTSSNTVLDRLVDEMKELRRNQS